MRLLRSLALACIGLGVLSCGDSTAPHPASGTYILESINGQPLPAFLSPIPEASISVLSGYLAIDNGSWNAVTVQNIREVYQNAPRETVDAQRYIYVIEGNSIMLLRFCVENDTALCRVSDGVISGSTVSLTVRHQLADQSFTYLYRRGPLPEDSTRACWLQTQLGLRGACGDDS